MEDNGFDTINVIPLVDVMLVLLTIVLTTTTFIAVGAIPVELPKAENSSAEIKKAITIEIDQEGIIYLDQTPKTILQLEQSLAQLERSESILIRADRDIALQIFVNVMDIVKGLGFSKVSLQTESMT
ncbi:MAG: biopolymer transporter ExbD [Desulfobulbaceae bacterium]|nr:biopolymer transporter ExbD [Desulfobulbaceae bacterium]